MNEINPSVPEKPARSRRVTAMVVATALAGVLAIATSGVAAAQTVEIGAIETPATTAVMAATATNGVHVMTSGVMFAQSDEGEGVHEVSSGLILAQPGDMGHEDWPELSPEDEAAFERYDQCLADAGVSFEAMGEADFIEIDDAAFEAAFEQCDAILDDLSDVFAGEFMEISPEDAAIWDQFDVCLEGAGVELGSTTSSFSEDIDGDALDAAFAQCDPILDGLSGDAFAFGGEFDAEFFDISPEDEAVFDRYDSCLSETGIDELFEAFEVDGLLGDELPDDAAIDAAFEQCDPILDDLSAQAQELFEDCPLEEEEA